MTCPGVVRCCRRETLQGSEIRKRQRQKGKSVQTETIDTISVHGKSSCYFCGGKLKSNVLLVSADVVLWKLGSSATSRSMFDNQFHMIHLQNFLLRYYQIIHKLKAINKKYKLQYKPFIWTDRILICTPFININKSLNWQQY